MPYCKIFIWFLLLFFMFLAPLSYYLCNSFSACTDGKSNIGRGESASHSFFPFFHWLHHSGLFQQPIHLCMVFQVNSFQYKLNWLLSLVGAGVDGVALCMWLRSVVVVLLNLLLDFEFEIMRHYVAISACGFKRNFFRLLLCNLPRWGCACRCVIVIQ